ncbi:MAG: hypothetical protein IPM39_28460 [Chloroflexi bacterium]|nr:hypothetical protein [Chloroflexota bacterium]
MQPVTAVVKEFQRRARFRSQRFRVGPMLRLGSSGRLAGVQPMGGLATAGLTTARSRLRLRPQPFRQPVPHTAGMARLALA